MSDSNPEKIHFFECSSCKTLHLSTSSDIKHYQCSHCNNKIFFKAEKRFLIHCPKCLEYWPKRVVRMAVHEGICECLNQYQCDGLLTIRKRWDGMPAQLVMQKNAFEDAEVISNVSPLPSDKLIGEQIEEIALHNAPNSNVKSSTEDVSSLDPFAEIFSNFDFSLDFATLSPSLTNQIINQYLLSLKLCYFDEIPLNSNDYIHLFSSMIFHLEESKVPLIREPVNYVYYVGDICGDFQQLQNLCNYFIPIIENFPAVKIIFLGNYFNDDHSGIEMFALLSLFTLKYPENVVLLRGAKDFHEMISPLSLQITSESLTPPKFQQIYRLIMHVLSRMPYFHIASMNQGQINILAQNTGIPINSTNPNKPFILNEMDSLLPLGKIKFNELGIDLQRIYTSKPETLSSMDESSGFSQEAFNHFLQANKCHYMVRSNEYLKTGIRFDFTNDLCCTIFSASNIKSHPSAESANYLPKIVRLVPGQSPTIIDAKDGLVSDLDDTFGISPADY
ncbi:hypothetical protein NEF87_001325 [Candidatus Lokiarchaeum ossiferum]|uniref:Serine/threonine specific protein phosphatases domain-containing protein n=1 Tax=Candidatus Lokiarchaeum ossiferum TaxID=2951803 RepID=A0ABY6HNF7_9ARCH|nr:hypothetical protein NEF87_001325 [Candidatus Lokiarchaeum sp. B-35]